MTSNPFHSTLSHCVVCLCLYHPITYNIFLCLRSLFTNLSVRYTAVTSYLKSTHMLTQTHIYIDWPPGCVSSFSAS